LKSWKRMTDDKETAWFLREGPKHAEIFMSTEKGGDKMTDQETKPTPTVPVDEGIITKTMSDPRPEKPFWKSRKFGYILLGILNMVLAAATGQAEFSPTEILTFSLGVAGLGVGAHTATDIAHAIKKDPTPTIDNLRD